MGTIRRDRYKVQKLIKRISTVFIILAIVFLVFLIKNDLFEGGWSFQGMDTKISGKQVAKGVEESYCGNNDCEEGEDSSSCCIDCGCPYGYSCDENTCRKLPTCGNGIQEQGENSENCCRDAGCPSGQICRNNKCIVLKPNLEYASFQTTESYSATFLKAKGEKLVDILINNNGNDDALNFKMTISSPQGYFSDKTFSLERISQNQETPITIGLNFLEQILDVTTDEEITLKADIVYYNSINTKFTDTETFKMHIAGRNYISWRNPDIAVSWVTPTQPSIREFATKATAGLPAGMSTSSPTVQKMAARWLFESMRAYGIKYVNDAHSTVDYLQFPIETLKNKAGDCDDHAILYASLLEAIGMKSFLVLVPGHIFAGYIDSNDAFIPVETTSSDFERALSRGIEEVNYYEDDAKIIIPTQKWVTYPQVNLPEKFDLKMPSITKQIGECKLSFNLEDFWVASVKVKFVNSGDAPGAGCAAVATYQNGEKRDEKFACWVINPQEEKEVEFQPDIDAFQNYQCIGY